MKNGFLRLKIAWQFMQALRRRSWTRDQVKARHAHALRRLRAYAYARSPFYARFHKGLTDRPLEQLPVLTKAQMMEHFDDLVTDRSVRLAHLRDYVEKPDSDGRFLGRYFATRTSGTSGLPGIFLQDSSEAAALLSSFSGSHLMTGGGINWFAKQRVALIASPKRASISAQLGGLAQSPRIPVLYLDAGQPAGGLIEQLNAWRPDALATYPSIIGILAEEQIAGRLRIAPKVIVTSAEVLTNKTRRRAETAWNAELFDTYGSTESGRLAVECGRHRGMHLLDDQVIVEIVDGANQPVPPGVYGEKVLITVLFRHTQPLIRYELSDMVRVAAEPCPCPVPYPVIDGVQGRTRDVLYFRTPRGSQVAVHPTCLYNIMEPVPAEWQVRPEAAGLRVLLSNIREPFNDELLVDALQRALAKQGAVAPPISIERVAAIPRNDNGKAPLIASTAPQTSRSG